MNHIRQKIYFFKIIDRVADLSFIILSFYLAIFFETYYHSRIFDTINYQSFNIFGLIISIITFLILIAYIERNFFYRLSNYFTLFKNTFKICFIAFLFIVSINFLLKTNLFFRSTVVFLFSFRLFFYF